MDDADRADDLIVRQLCAKAAAATTGKEFDAALAELRSAIRDSMNRARYRVNQLAVVEITEKTSDAAD